MVLLKIKQGAEKYMSGYGVNSCRFFVIKGSGKGYIRKEKVFID